MKYVSIDLRTTGLDPIKNDILEIGLIVEDTATKATFEDASKLRIWVDKEYYRGNPFALVQNAKIIEKICDLRRDKSKRLVQPDDVFTKIANFLRPHFATGNLFETPIVVAGKNYQSLDKSFLSRLKGFENLPFHPRVLEPGFICVNWKDDSSVPSLTASKNRLGIDQKAGDDTLADAWDVIQVLRSQY